MAQVAVHHIVHYVLEQVHPALHLISQRTTTHYPPEALRPLVLLFHSSLVQCLQKKLCIEATRNVSCSSF